MVKLPDGGVGESVGEGAWTTVGTLVILEGRVGVGFCVGLAVGGAVGLDVGLTVGDRVGSDDGV
jgi:hypothetical protein